MGQKWDKLLQLVKSMDYLGNRVELMIDRSSTYRTYLGSVLTALAFLVLTGYTVITVQKIFDRTNPTILTQTEYDRENTNSILRDSQILPAFGMYDRITNEFEPDFEKYTTLKVSLYKANFDYDKKITVFSRQELNITRCGSLQNKAPYRLLFDNQNLAQVFNYLICIEWPADLHFPIKGDRMEKDFTYLDLNFMPCSRRAACATVRDLAYHQMFSVNVKMYVRYSDFDSPIKNVVTLKEELNLQQNVGTAIFQNIKQTRIVDNTNYLQPRHDPLEFTEIAKEEMSTYQRLGQITCTEAEIASKECIAYLNMVYRHTGITDTITRTYADVQNSISDIGGFKEIVLFVLILLYCFYNQRYMDTFVATELLPPSSLLSLAKEKESIKEMATTFQTKHPGHKTEAKKAIKSLNHKVPMVVAGKSRKSKNNHGGPFLNVISPNQILNMNPEARRKAESRSLERDMKLMLDDAKEHFDGLTEITTIVRELSSWQVFKDIVLQDYQRRLLPVVEIEASKRRREAEKSRTLRSSNVAAVSSNKVLQRVVEVVSDTMDMRTALDLLKTIIEKTLEKPPENWEDGLRSKIDQFILDSLPNFESSAEGPDKKTNSGGDPFSSLGNAIPNNSEQVSIHRPRNGLSGVEYISELSGVHKENHLSGSRPQAGINDMSVSRVPLRKIDRQ